jgi:hypothetical protein
MNFLLPTARHPSTPKHGRKVARGQLPLQVVQRRTGHPRRFSPSAASVDVGNNGSMSSGEQDGSLPLAKSGKIREYAEVAYLTGRSRKVSAHFSTAMGIDDFLHRLEIALYAYGFHGDNSIGELWVDAYSFPCFVLLCFVQFLSNGCICGIPHILEFMRRSAVLQRKT